MKMLKDLNPGDMFKREGGKYRYIVSASQEEHCGNVTIYCYNLDGETDGYWWAGGKRVIPMAPQVSYWAEGKRVIPMAPPEVSYNGSRPKPFYMCYVEGGSTPTHKHEDRYLARSEAGRLAKLTGKRTFVLEAISSVDYTPPQYSAYYWYENLRQKNR